MKKGRQPIMLNEPYWTTKSNMSGAAKNQVPSESPLGGAPCTRGTILSHSIVVWKGQLFSWLNYTPSEYEQDAEHRSENAFLLVASKWMHGFDKKVKSSTSIELGKGFGLLLTEEDNRPNIALIFAIILISEYLLQENLN